MSLDTHALLQEFCKKFNKIESYLEIGVREGDSSKIVLENAPNLKEIYLCDTYKGFYGGSNRGNHNHLLPLEQQYPKVKFTFLDGDSKLTIPTINDKQFDLIYIDGDHSPEGALTDLVNCHRILKERGFIIVDDICHPSHKYLIDIVSKFSNSYKMKVFYINNLFNSGSIVMQK